MPRFVDTLKHDAPDIYWFAVELLAAKHPYGHKLAGQRKYSNRYVVGQIAWRVQAHNEKAALENRPLISVPA